MSYCAGGPTFPRAKFNFYPSGMFPVIVPPFFGAGPQAQYRQPHLLAGQPVPLHEYAIQMCMPPQ